MALKSGRVGIHPSQVDPITGMLLTSPGGASDLSDLDDVAISSVSNDQILRYNSTTEKWENEDMPSIPAAQVNSDWNAVSGVAQILNKPTIPDALDELTDVDITSAADGDYLVYDGTNNKWINSGSTPGPVVPEGSTVTPTDDIQTWLACAGITDKTYTTLAEVLNDSTTLLALISSNNASDYLVRSTTWASGLTADSTAMTDIGANDYCAETLLADSTWCNAICNSTYFESVLTTKVPTMTSNTTPSGECIYSTIYGSYYAYYAFDGNDNTTSAIYNQADTYLGYKFASAVSVKCVEVALQSGEAARSCKVQGSNDNSTWVDINTYTFTDIKTKYPIVNTDDFLYHRILNPAKVGEATTLGVSTIQFYGR